MMENTILKKISELRKQKGLSYENLAYELNISPSAYRKIELNETKLTVDRLYKIAEILNVDISDLLDINPNKFYNQKIAENSNGYQDIKNLHTISDNYINLLIRQFEKRIQAQEELISILKTKQ